MTNDPTYRAGWQDLMSEAARRLAVAIHILNYYDDPDPNPNEPRPEGWQRVVVCDILEDVSATLRKAGAHTEDRVGPSVETVGAR